ncbi:uncharacterized protein PV09_09266 [Verruconis gallopava]|uniref:Uncharacterized protein n=1 Tax=Verruconis gallopava TaxID=253628 RepID=A0A0D1YE62_9PEZI|nr:uncharacterized protein PV09_09266 [Verruconis gallopava]KIV98986.1 hypothetical protein PV09_09266 [Verruconis gallopava]
MSTPLRGTGKHGYMKDDDFLGALQIDKSKYQEIRRTCVRILDEQSSRSTERLDLRTYWSRQNGQATKSAMLAALINAFPGVFDDVSRFTHAPPNWDTTKLVLAEACFISANAYRSRQLQNASPCKRDTRNPSTPPTSTLYSDEDIGKVNEAVYHLHGRAFIILSATGRRPAEQYRYNISL